MQEEEDEEGEGAGSGAADELLAAAVDLIPVLAGMFRHSPNVSRPSFPNHGLILILGSAGQADTASAAP